MRNRPQTIVFDMDGTLVDVSSIRHHVLGGPKNGYRKNFDAFHRDAVNCPEISWVANAARDAKGMGYKVIQVTARSECYRPSTSWWIAEHFVPSDGLYMRADRDYRPDYVVKREILDRLLSRFDIVKAYDDNPNVVALWAEYGIPCIVVPGWVDE
jgi:phosphoglycolate phosphatase-like HAD superfamily hydrolase